MTKRDVVEDFLLNNIKHISSFDPNNSTIDKYKNGNFGLSTIGFSLYSNGHNLRGKSTHHKYGLLYEDGENIVSIGYFRKETDIELADGYIFFTAPAGPNIADIILDIIGRVSMSELPVKGFYVRYLNLENYLSLLSKGGLPIKESPWHPEASEEDETFNNSLVDIDNVISLSEDSFTINKIEGLSKNSKKKIKYAFARFTNFLTRNNLVYRLEYLEDYNSQVAFKIIKSHFEMLRKYGKNIGSTPEDHFNAVDPSILKNRSCMGFIGFLSEIPVSIFVGESISDDTFALYTPFTLRDTDLIDTLFPIDKMQEFTGLSAMPTYAYVQLLYILKRKGFKYVDFGGSELADLNKFKRQMGGENKPSYWTYFPIKKDLL